MGSAACSQLMFGGVDMAKGQVRGNKETRKPKKDKSVSKVVSTEGSQVKLAGGNASFGKKDKK